jgi:hypothetical protein
LRTPRRAVQRGALKDQFVEYKWNLAVRWTSPACSVWCGIIGRRRCLPPRIFEEVGLPTDPAEVDSCLHTWDGFLEAAEKVYIPGKRWLVPSASTSRVVLDEPRLLQREAGAERGEGRRAGGAQCRHRHAPEGLGRAIDDMWSNDGQRGLRSGAIACVAAG